MQKVSASQSARIAELETSLGSKTLRTLLSDDGKRIVRPDRLSHLLGGSGKLSEGEAERLAAISRNANQIRALQKRGAGKQDFRVNRAVRTWVVNGKKKGTDVGQKDEMGQKKKRATIRALAYLGVDPSDGTFYIA